MRQERFPGVTVRLTLALAGGEILLRAGVSNSANGLLPEGVPTPAEVLFA